MKSLSPLLVLALLVQTPVRTQPAASPVHRLDPLSAAEITLVTDALSKAGRMSAATRVVTIELSEPDKAQRTQARVGRAVLYDWSSATTTELTVDLQSRAVSAPVPVAKGDPPVRRVVIDRATEIALGDRRVVQALARHGVTALDRITFLGGLGEGTRLPGVDPRFRSSSRRWCGTASATTWRSAGSTFASISAGGDRRGGLRRGGVGLSAPRRPALPPRLQRVRSGR